MKKLILYFIAITPIFMCCNSTISSYKSNETTLEDHSVFMSYYLPKSYLKVKVPIEKKSLVKGLIDSLKSESKKNVENYWFVNFGLKQPKLSDIYSIGEKIQFNPITVPDKDRHFKITYKKAKVLAQTLNLKLSKDGIISSGEFAQENKTFEFVSEGLGLGASLAGKFFSLGPDSDEILFKGDTSIEIERIEILTKEMHGLLDAKKSILSKHGNDISKDVLVYRMTELDKRIRSIQNQVLGYLKTSTTWVGFIYEAKRDTTDILALDPKNGIQIPGDTTNVLAFIKADTTKIDLTSIKKLTIIASRNTPILNDSFISKPVKGKAYLWYNLPPRYSLQLLYDNKALSSFKDSDDKKGNEIYSMYFPQNGPFAGLSGNFKATNVLYYEDIGAIKEIKFEKTATVTKERIQSSYAAADSLISLKESVKAYKEAKKAASQPAEEETEESEETIIRLIIEDGDIPILEDDDSTN